MTFHVHRHKAWKLGDPIPASLIDEIATVINHNRFGCRFTPPVFGIWCHGDGIAMALASMLDAYDWRRVRDNGPDDFLFSIQEVNFRELFARLLPRLQWPVDPKDVVPFAVPDRISLPRIKGAEKTYGMDIRQVLSDNSLKSPIREAFT